MRKDAPMSKGLRVTTVCLLLGIQSATAAEPAAALPQASPPPHLVFPEVHGVKVDADLDPGLLLVSDDRPVKGDAAERKRLETAWLPVAQDAFSHDDDLKTIGVVYYVQRTGTAGPTRDVPGDACDISRASPTKCAAIVSGGPGGKLREDLRAADARLEDNHGIFVNPAIRPGIVSMTVDLDRTFADPAMRGVPAAAGHPGMLVDYLLQTYATAYGLVFMATHPGTPYVSIILNVVSGAGQASGAAIRPAVRFLIPRPIASPDAGTVFRSTLAETSRSMRLSPWFSEVLKSDL